MKGFYAQFAFLAIRLLVAIYTNALIRQGVAGQEIPLIVEAEHWLEANK